MKRTPSPSKTWKRGIAALGALAGLALAPAPAHAQPCADLGDIADDLLNFYFDEFESLVHLSQKTSDSMTKNFSSACSSAVKDAVKCWDRQLGTIPKVAKTACAEGSPNPADCYDAFKTQAKAAENVIDAQAEAANSDCSIDADEFFDFCRFGP